MTLDSIDAVTLPRNRCRRDGTSLRVTFTVPTKPCCGGVVLLGEVCDCGPSEAVDAARAAYDSQAVTHA